MRLLGVLRRVPPVAFLFATIILGILLLLSHFAVGSAEVTYSRDGVMKEVGFASAVNWWLGFTIIAPLSMYFMLSAFRTAERIPRQLIDSGMLITSDGAVAPLETVTVLWDRLMHAAAKWAIPLFVLATIISMAEWWPNSGEPLLKTHQLPKEIDWSVAALIPGSPAEGRFALNAAVSFFAFAVQTFYILAIVAFVLFLIAFCEFIRRLSDRDVAPLLVLGLRSEDRRRGFQLFRGLVENVLLGSAFGFLLFYVSHVWNLYLPSKLSSFWAFVTPDIASGFQRREWKEIATRLLDIGGFNYSGAMDLIAFLVLFSLCVAIPLVLLRKAALDAQETTLRVVNAGQPGVFSDLAPAEALKRANDLTVWPLGYPKANQLLVLGLIALFSMFFFRLGLFYVGLLIAYATKKAYDALK